MSIHINALKDDIAKIVLMPGDPLRAKYIADSYLTNVKQINNLRNMLGFTGEYKGQKITVIASGMGMPSMGIYAYELYKEYDVEVIIRIGSCGSYLDSIKLRDIILVAKSITDSNYAYLHNGKKRRKIASNEAINQVIEKVATLQNINYVKGNIYCTDTFYGQNDLQKLVKKDRCIGVEMESFALFYTAGLFQKQATCLLTVSDSVITKEALSGDARERTFNQMIELALEAIISL